MSAPRLRPREAAVVAFPASRRASFGPTARSLAIGIVLAAAATLAYVGARESSLFAVRTIVVSGAPPPVAAEVRAALAPVDGRSLVALGADDVIAAVTAVPEVESASYDRAFPHTLRVVVRLERPLAVLRQGRDAWLVSRTGRVVRPISPRALPKLPRLWEPRSFQFAVGRTLTSGGGGEEVAALEPVRAAGLVGIVKTIRVARDGFTYMLRGGAEVRAGAPDQLLLKLSIARQILTGNPSLAFLDVSVPERPVAATKAQVSG